jgi:hypothetical protein
MPFRLLLSFGLLAVTAAAAFAVDDARPLDLVGADAALVLEIRQPKAAWNEIRGGELFHRFEQTGLYAQITESAPFRKWQRIDQQVADATGAPLFDQMLDLCGEDLVLAVYLSDRQEPEGVLLTRADEADAVARVLQNWQRLEPQATVATLKHLGHSYFRRAQSAARKPELYYTRFGPVFALSDHESRIQQVIGLHGSDSSRAPAGWKRFRETEVCRRAELASADSPPDARLLMPARPWEDALRDAAAADDGAALLARFWPAIDFASVELHVDQGLQLQSRIQLVPDRVSDDWKAWAVSPPNADAFLANVPPEAVLVATGGIRFGPLGRLMQDLTKPAEKDNWHKSRRIIQGFLGGRDVITDVLPALCRDVGLYLTVSPNAGRDIPLDGVLVCRFPNEETASGLDLALDQAFAAGLALLSANVNETHPDSEPAVVRSELTDREILRWLDTPLPIRIAYRLTPESLIVSRSVAALRRHLEDSRARVADAFVPRLRLRWFPDAEQFLCLNVRGLRERLPEPIATSGDSDAAQIDVTRELLRLCDAAFLAARFAPDAITLRAGIVVESAN